MKTAISVPDHIFARVENAARRLGISRSEFFSRAAENWADELDRDGVAEMINAVLDGPVQDENTEFIRSAARQVLSDQGDQ